MLKALASEFLSMLQGSEVTVAKREYDWLFTFRDRCALGVSSPWRIVQSSRIAFANSDDRQQFGLSKPIDGEARVNALLRGGRVISLDLDRETADLHINFGQEIRIDVFNHSSGYEGWQATWRTPNEDVCIIGLGGGELAVLRTPLPDNK